MFISKIVLLLLIFMPSVVLADVVVPAGAQSVPKMCNIIPSGTMQFVAVFEASNYTCERGYYLPRTSETCVICPANHFCPGGEYTYSETDDVGINACPDGASAPAGMWDASQCSGAKLHLGKDVLYLSPVKRTEPALHFDTNHDGVADLFGNMTTADVPMNKDTDKKLKIRYKGTVYSVYDDTVQVTE